MSFRKGLLAVAVIAGLTSAALADAPELASPKLGALAFVRRNRAE